MISRWRCLCAYDGTDFAGWQKQPSGDAVQDKIEKGLEGIFHSPVRTVGAGRTDAGVHAKGQVFHFDFPWRHGSEKLLHAMRAHLPVGISPRSVVPVRPFFHSQISAKGKRYRYCAVEGWAMPKDDRFVLSLKKQRLDLGKMKMASQHLVGTHDFSSFCASRGKGEEENALRTVWKVDVSKRGSAFKIDVEGSGFLYKMVRSFAGVLFDVGVGRIEPLDVGRILKNKKRSEKVVSAPAKGLCLEKVFYRKPALG